jgi:hypothetical protein
MGKINWRGDAFLKEVDAEVARRTSAAAVRLQARIRAEVSQPGTLRYGGSRDSKGRSLKGTGRATTIYNFTHSRPGNPPYKQTGHLRRSIAWELIRGTLRKVVGRVGTNLKYGLYLERGTAKMKARPYLRATLAKFKSELKAILTRKLPSGGLGPVSGNQFRSGQFGAGARKAGF